jgi:hypothetical protein
VNDIKLREFADMLTDREYGHEITKEEEALAKELGFVVVFGYSDDNAELRGAIDDEIGCFDGGVLEHKDLQGTILAEWCPEDIDCSWYFSSTQQSEKFYIFEGEDLYCVGIVIDNNKPKPMTNADRIRAMSDKELSEYLVYHNPYHTESNCLKWLQQPVEVDNG